MTLDDCELPVGTPADRGRRRLCGDAERGAAAVQSGHGGGRRSASAAPRSPRRPPISRQLASNIWARRLGESLPTLRAQLAAMQIETDGLSARVDDLVDHLERPRETTMLRVLETKAAAGDAAIAVTSAAMRTCGGAAFSKHLSVERLFRDAHAGAVMAPTRCPSRIHREGGPGDAALLTRKLQARSREP